MGPISSQKMGWWHGGSGVEARIIGVVGHFGWVHSLLPWCFSNMEGGVSHSSNKGAFPYL